MNSVEALVFAFGLLCVGVFLLLFLQLPWAIGFILAAIAIGFLVRAGWFGEGDR